MVGSSSLHPQRTFSVVILPVSLPPAADSRHSISGTAAAPAGGSSAFPLWAAAVPGTRQPMPLLGRQFLPVPRVGARIAPMPGTFLQNLLVLLRQCIPCAAGSQLHLRYAAVLIGHVVPRHLVVLHGIVGRPVVFGGIDLPGFKRRVHVAVSRGLRHCTQQADHVDHDLRILHADGLALQIIQAAHRLTGIERAGTRVVPAQPTRPCAVKSCKNSAPMLPSSTRHIWSAFR